MSQQTEFRIDGTATAPVTIVLAHRAGAGLDTPFMAAFAEGLADNGIATPTNLTTTNY
jgi:predicted alpha/beta-hydrolase family hydrolase